MTTHSEHNGGEVLEGGPLKGPGLLPRWVYKTVFETEEAPFKVEKQLLESMTPLVNEKRELLQKVYKLEELINEYQRMLLIAQRIRIEAANAKAKDRTVGTVTMCSPFITEMKEKSGLSFIEIQKALILLKEAKDKTQE